MSSDLSNRAFPETANSGALNWLFEGFRTRMRNTAKFVRMEAAWRTWPAIHRVAKAMHEGLITNADRDAARASDLHDLAKRCADMYPTKDHLIQALNEGKEHVALGIGVTDTNIHGITLDDVLELYEAQYVKTREQYAAENPTLTLPPTAPEIS